LVVHFNHGIGKYLGIEKRPNVAGVLSEFFTIEYADSAKLYVPINQAHLISKYIGASEEMPTMHSLGSNRWKRTRDQTQQAITGYASDLLEIYAKREMAGGFIYPKDTPDVLEFEEEFPYVETEDQLLAVSNIKEDMCSAKAMDRLVCGDVGYGKTEVAMRAAFKAVVDGKKQVAVLVPTTVLAMQHFETFSDRMRNFPINVGVLSRFNTPKQTRETLKGIEQGSIDIVVGTHRLVSEDVAFKDLGLVIIDEEQRFGVKSKEHLKKIKAGVDCLTLSATPIPRTLYMSLIGARDMSIINTPPQDRVPIKSIVTESTDQTIKNALLRELARDGQAFVIHNRVETIYEMANRIKKLLPQARIVVGHGQMSSDEIDSVFHAFKSGKADILIATSIVENGIDIPNANTILIDRADQFGLADLYQLRGRVGRWNRRAYAYIMVPNLRILSEMSRKRLFALAEASGYGGGMKIAMRDLEIRGAGDIIGYEQSGHVSSIGFHLYCKMLKRTIQTLQGKVPAFITDVKIEIPVDARLPEEYVNEVSLRMEFYQRLGEVVSWDEIDLIWEEIQDRFGPPPPPAIWLYHYARIRVYAALNGFTLIKVETKALTIEQQKGKETETRKVLFQMPAKPEELEAKLIETLGRVIN
jgi:transcription-repair coupling factor (superfamily II helicase)